MVPVSGTHGLIDMHTHTTCSDGSIEPAALVAMAGEIGLSAIAITDHDTTKGVECAMIEGARRGVEVIPGLEFSSVYKDDVSHDVHILGLFVRTDHMPLQSVLAKQARHRHDRALEMVERLRLLGYDISPDEGFSAQDRTITRGQIARALIEKGYAKTMSEALREFLSEGKPAYIELEVEDPRDAIRLIHEADGLAIVAHLNQIDKKRPGNCVDICRMLIKEGADGMEVMHSSFDTKWRATAIGLCLEMGCLPSGGSDFHGRLKKNVRLGSGTDNVSVPYEYLERMRHALS